jgi:DNA polymerase
MIHQFLFVDYETFSLADLTVVGLDNYVKHPSTGISMLAWALDEEDVEVWLPHCERFPPKLLSALRNPKILKIAWNASFEYNVTKYVTTKLIDGGLFVPMSEWRDPMVLAHNLSLPGKLEKVAIILKMAEQKDPRGDELKFMFCEPVSHGGETTLFGIAPPLFRDHVSHPKEFAEYIEYCKQDVRAERALWHRLRKIGFTESDWQGWLLDQKINEFGIPGRRDLAEKGWRLALRFIKDQKQICKDLTGLDNPNSDVQMKAWLKLGPRGPLVKLKNWLKTAADPTITTNWSGYTWNSLGAPRVAAELADPNSKVTPECRKALQARASARKSSYTKIEKFLALLASDDRLRYQLRYMGAPRTGRWASGGGEEASMQVQNLPRGVKAVKKKLELALRLLASEDYDGIIREFCQPAPNPKDSLTVVDFVITLLRSLFQAKPGKVFHVADKNAIENRMLGWAAGCKAILDVFRTCNECGYLVEDLDGAFLCPKCSGKKARCPYISFGVHLYSKPYQELWARYSAGNEEERQNSKPPVLGGGYGLGGGEMYTNSDGDVVRGGLWGYALSVCGVDMPKDLAHKAVKILRDAWPEVVIFWSDLEEAFKQVYKRGGVIKVGEVTWDKQAKEWVEHPTHGKQCVLTFRRIAMGDGCYTIRLELPSGRALHYLNVSIDEETRTSQKTGLPYTAYTIHYDGIEHSATQGADGKTAKKKHKWGRVKTYGGKICENVIQAMSRDDLLNSMFLADEMGFGIWGLFHDEIATEDEDDPFGLRLDDLIWCMVQIPWWAPGLLLGAEGYTSQVYKKG